MGNHHYHQKFIINVMFLNNFIATLYNTPNIQIVFNDFLCVHFVFLRLEPNGYIHTCSTVCIRGPKNAANQTLLEKSGQRSSGSKSGKTKVARRPRLRHRELGAGCFWATVWCSFAACLGNGASLQPDGVFLQPKGV